MLYARVKDICLVLVLALLAGYQVQAQSWQSATLLSTGIGGGALVDVTTADDAGNLYVVGRFVGTLQLGAATLSCIGNDHLFIAKWNTATRTFVWATQTDGTGSHCATRLAVSGRNVYVAGSFNYGTASFGGTTLTTSGNTTGFVAKLLDAGTSVSFGWAQQLGNYDGVQVAGLAVAGPAVYVGGSFRAQTLQLGPFALACVGGTNLFVAKLVDAGATASYAWAQRAGNSFDAGVNALAVSGTSLYLLGRFSATITLGATTHTGSAPALNDSDMFVAKMTDTGTNATYDWSVSADCSVTMYAADLVLSGTSVYVTGDFQGAAVVFGSLAVVNPYPSTTDAFVAKLTDAGTAGGFVWAQRAGGPGADYGSKLLVSGSSVYLAGTFRSYPATFGRHSLYALPDIHNPGLPSYDLFVARLLDAGATSSFEWALSAGGGDIDYCGGLALVGNTLYLGGGAYVPVTFGSQTLTGAGANVGAFLAAIQNPVLPTRAGTNLPGLNIFPNPAHGLATVRVPADAGPATLEVVNAVGQVVRRQVAPAGQDVTLKLAGLAPGVYAVRVQLGDEAATRRLVVE